MFRRSIARMAAITPDVHHVLRYSYVSDIMEKRPAFRGAHLEHATKWKDLGKLKMGGAYDPAEDGALVIFKASKEEVEEFAREDPYVKGGLVTSWDVKAWNVVI